jgi:hypothetical protein
MMDRLARALPDVLFIGIAMAPRRQTLDYLDSHPVSYPQLLAPRDPGALLRRLGDPSGALPHTVVLKPDHSICAYRTGEIDATWLRMVLQQCR